MNDVNRARTSVFGQVREQDAAAGGAQRLQDHGLLDAAPLGGGKRPGQHEGAGQQGDAAGRPHGDHDAAEDDVEGIDGVLDADGGGGRKGAADLLGELGLDGQRRAPSAA